MISMLKNEIFEKVDKLNYPKLNALSDWQIVDNYGKIRECRALAYYNEDVTDDEYFTIVDICKRYEREIDRRF